MKKAYLEPSVVCIEIDSNNVIASSITLSVNCDADAVDGSVAQGRNDNTSSASSIWDQGW